MDREAFLECAADHASHVSVETECGEFLIATHDAGLHQALFVERTRPEFRVLRLVTRILSLLLGEDAIKGRTFVDVGANIGTEAVAALRSHRFGAAVCCEPEPHNFRLLEANLALNGLGGRARALNVAVSNREGRALLAVVPDRRGKSWIGTREQIEAKEERMALRYAEAPDAYRLRRGGARPTVDVVEVATTTLDALEVGDPGLVWIDAEGHEGHILEGARTLIERGIPVVTEFKPDSLDERGGRARIQAALEGNYTHFTDVRRRRQYGLREITDLGAYAEDLLSRTAFTDLLLLRLDSEQAGRGLPKFGAKTARDRG